MTFVDQYKRVDPLFLLERSGACREAIAEDLVIGPHSMAACGSALRNYTVRGIKCICAVCVPDVEKGEDIR